MGDYIDRGRAVQRMATAHELLRAAAADLTVSIDGEHYRGAMATLVRAHADALAQLASLVSEARMPSADREGVPADA